MIVNKYNYGGGGSGSGVTPQDVQQQIDSALTPYWESAETQSAISEAVSGLASEEYVQEALSGVDLTNYYTSAQTESAITQAVSGKADAANVTARGDQFRFPYWNAQGVITGETGQLSARNIGVNGGNVTVITSAGSNKDFYAPTAAGTTGQVLMSSGSGNAPVWVTPATINGSAITSGGNIEIQAGGGGITSADVKTQIEAYNYVTSAQAETQITNKGYITDQALTAYTPTSGFSTINGSAITEGGNIVIEGGSGPAPDMSSYMTSGDAQVISTALVDLNDRVADLEYDNENVVVKGQDASEDQMPIRAIARIYQDGYDVLAEQGLLDPQTLYVVLPTYDPGE